MFICNHGPYVLSWLESILKDAQDVQSLGIGMAAISANDAIAYPQDSYENMVEIARLNGFSSPYLYDESQIIARAYYAVCTPIFWVQPRFRTVIQRAS